MDGYYEFPPHIEPKARDLVKSFLCADRSLRLGFARVSGTSTFLQFNLNSITVWYDRTEQRKLSSTSGSEVSTGEWWSAVASLHPGSPESETLSIHSTSTGMQSRRRVTRCRRTINRGISPTFEIIVELLHRNSNPLPSQGVLGFWGFGVLGFWGM